MMKKIWIIITLACLSILTYGQSERVFNSNMKISKVAPRFTLSGLGATILMDGATSGTTTLRPYAAAGGTIVIPQSASTDTLETKSGARSVYAPKANATFTGTIGLPTTTEYNGVRMDSVFVSYIGANQTVNLGSESLTTGGAITTTGMLTTGILKVSTTTNSVSIDSLTTDGDDIKFYDAADTLNPYIPYGFREIGIAASDTSAMLDPYAPLLSPALLGTPTAPTAAASTNTTQIATTAFVQTSNEIIRIAFKVDSTLYAPETDDSLYTDGRLIGKNVAVWRGGATASLGKLYEQSWVDDTNVGYEFNDVTGKITFHPKFTTGEKIIIEASDTNKYTTGIDPYYLLRSDEYAAAYAAMETPFIGDTIFWQDDMVYSLDSLGVWDRTDLFYMFQTNNSTDALLNWVDPGNHTASLVNAPTFTRLEGFTGNGTSSYINTNYNPCVDSVNFGKLDASFGIYLRKDRQKANDYVASGGGTMFMVARNTSDQVYGRLNSTNSTGLGSVADGDGLWIYTRRANTGTSPYPTEIYRNGLSVDTENAAATSVTSANIWLLHYSTTEWSDNQIGCFFVMNGISEDEDDALVAAINTIIERYMDRLEKGVE